MQVSRKQDTYYLKIKEDLRKFYCFSLKKKTNSHNCDLMTQLRLN